MKVTTLILFALLASWALSSPAYAQEFDDSPFFDYNQKMRTAHQNALRLRIKDAKIALQLEKSQNPYNVIPHYIDDFADFMQVLANENHAEFLRMLKQRDIRLAKIRTGDKSSPYYLFCTAAIQLQWAWIHIKFDEPAEALKAVRAAIPDIERNAKSYPDFVGNRTLLGVAQIMNEWLEPKKAQDKAAMGFIALRDAISYGKQYPKFEFNEYTHFWYGLMLLHLGSDDDKDWRHLSQTVLDPANSPTGTYLLASMHLHLNNSAYALPLLEKAPKTDAFHPLHQLLYLRGLCLLSQFNAKADTYFQLFLTSYKGEHHLKNTLQKLAWSAISQQNSAVYTQRMGELLRRGNTVDPNDYFAEEEALRRVVPDQHLTRVKISFLSGKFDVARTEILKASSANPYDAAEIQFYKARIEHKMKRYDDALLEYQRLINDAKHKNKYVTAYAELYSGMIWAERGNITQARQHYNNCLKSSPDAFKQHIHFRAQYQLSLTQGLSNTNTTSQKKGATIGGIGKQ